MARFLTEADYSTTIKSEIKQLVTGSDSTTVSAKQLAAEDMAIATIKEYIGGKYDCVTIFSQIGSDRNLFMVRCVIVIVLYMMYQQTGAKDIPEHRVQDYDDVIKWLINVGEGNIATTLDALTDDDFLPEMRLSSRPYINQKW